MGHVPCSWYRSTGLRMPKVPVLRVSGAGLLPGARATLQIFAGAALTLGACTSAGTLSPEESSRQLDHDMFVTGYEDIADIYVTEPNMGALALAGMQQLSSIDPSVVARRSGDTLELVVNNRPVESIAVNDGLDARHWGEVTADVLDQARASSDKIAGATSEKLFEGMFDGIIGKLDQFSHYASAANAADNRAQRDGFGGIGVTISVEDGQVRVV